jgi:hypothetical protein
MFLNPQVPTQALPRVDHVQWQPLHPRYVREQQLVRGVVIVIIAIAWFVLMPWKGASALAIIPFYIVALIAGVALVLWPSVEVPRRGFALREHDMIYRHGVLFRKVTAVPFNRIQHVEVSNGPLDRRFGIGTLKLFTAGGSGGDLLVEGLPIELAEQLREHILGKAGVAIERD